MAARVLLVTLGLLTPAGSLGEGKAQEDFRGLAQQAAQAQQDGQEERAIQLYLKALEIDPVWADGWRKAGMLLADRREFGRAEAAFKKLLAIDPKSGSGWALLGLCEYELGRYDEAYRHIQRGRTLGVGNEDLENVASYHAALIMIQKGEFEIALRHLVLVARAGVDDQDAIIAFGLTALRMAAKPECLDPQQKALVTRVGEIELEAAHNKLTEVITAYEALLREQPRTPGLHYAFGNFLIGAEHYDQALEEMQKELELNPKDARALLQVAMTDIKLNRPEQAVPYAEKAVGLAPDLFAAHYAVGWALYKLGQNDRAIQELEQAVRLAPGSPQAHYSLSMAYMRAHRKNDASRERERFSRLKQEETPPGGPPAEREDSRTGP